MMLRYVTSTFVACAFAGSVSVLAQQPQQPQPQQPPAQPAPKAEVPKATLTGCVAQAKTTDGGTAYVLDKTEGGSAKMYLLVGSTPTELSSNVNKMVQVSGPVTEPNAPAADGPASDQKVLRPPAVQIETIKVVAEACK